MSLAMTGTWELHAVIHIGPSLCITFKSSKARDRNMSTLSCGPMSNSICHLFTTKTKWLNPLVFQPKIKSQTQLLPSFLICSAIIKVEFNFDHLSVVIANAGTMWNKVEDGKLCPLFMDLDHKNTFLNHSNVFTINNIPTGNNRVIIIK